MITELDQQTWGQEVAGPRQRIEDEGVRVLLEELTQSGLDFVPPAHLGKKKFGQDADVISICFNYGRIGFGCRFDQVCISPRDEVWSRIVLLTAEGVETL